MSLFRTIVAAIDFSETSDDALRVASALACSLGSTLHLLHVIPDARQQAWSVEAPGLDFSALQQESIADAEHVLATRTLPAETPVANVVRRVISGLPAAREIAQYAATNNADLIVVGTHGYGPVRRLVLGSVADRLVRLAPCPVLMVPHHTLRASGPSWALPPEKELTPS